MTVLFRGPIARDLKLSSQTGICHGNHHWGSSMIDMEFEVLSNNMKQPLPNVKRHSGAWQCTATPSIEKNEPNSFFTEFEWFRQTIFRGRKMPTVYAWHLVCRIWACICSYVWDKFFPYRFRTLMLWSSLSTSDFATSFRKSVGH